MLPLMLLLMLLFFDDVNDHDDDDDDCCCDCCARFWLGSSALRHDSTEQNRNEATNKQIKTPHA